MTGSRTVEAFTYDRVGNRLTGPGTSESYTYNAGHQLLTGPGATYGYDANGNRTTKTDVSGTTTYTWDAADRLVQAVVQTATGDTTTVTFTYDALGRRVRKTVAETTGGSTTTRTTDYVYDQEDIIWQVESVQVGGGVPTSTATRVVHGPGIDEPLLVEDGGQALAVHADALGSITGLSDASQTLVEASTYTSFGQLARSGSVAGNSYAYTGREWEPELGLSYYRARYYDPEAGRFLSRDPIGFAGGLNAYIYVENDPLRFVDPSGLARCSYYIREHYVVCVSEGTGEIVRAATGIHSGLRECKNDPGCADKKDAGPVPPGTYNISPNTLPNREGWWALQSTDWIPNWSGLLCTMGFLRCGYNIHLGSFSLGCITFEKADVLGREGFRQISAHLIQRGVMREGDAPALLHGRRVLSRHLSYARGGASWVKSLLSFGPSSTGRFGSRLDRSG